MKGKKKNPQEMVNHPDHYNQHPSGVECIDIIEHFTANVAFAIKHVWRSGLKPLVEPEQPKKQSKTQAKIAAQNEAKEKLMILQDLKKARWYIDREIQRVEKFWEI